MIRVALGLVWLVVLSTVASSQVLDLRVYLAQVEASNPSIAVAAYEPELANAEITSALGRFDPSLTLVSVYEDKSGTDKLNSIDGALELPLNMLFGPTLKATYSRGIGSSVNPQTLTSLPGEATIGVSLPLFQGIFTDSRRNQLNKALLRPEVASAQYRMDRNSLLRDAALAYWTWAEAEAAVTVADSVIRLIEERLTQIRRRTNVGEQAAIDTIEVVQELYRRRGERLSTLRVAEQTRVNASVYLWSADRLPQTITQNPSPLPGAVNTTFDRFSAIDTALRRRPEIQRIDALQRMARLDSSLAQEFLRPMVKLDAALAAYDVSSPTSLDYKIGLNISQPLLFRTAQGNAQMAGITVQRADLSRMLVERVVAADAQNAAIALERALQRLDLAEQEVALAGQMVVAERTRFNTGESSLLTLNLRERFLAEALMRRVAAQADVARAEVTLLWATGTI